MRASQPRDVGAFTLMELLIAISITALIVVLLSQVFTAAAGQWQAADQRIDSFRDARAALQVMTRDLGLANLSGDAQMLTLSNYDSSGTYAKEAFAISPIANSGKSDLCAVGYYLAWDAKVRAYRLKRLFNDSDATAATLANASPDFTALFTKNAAKEEDVATYAWDLRFAPGTLANVEAPNANPSTKWQWLEVRFKAMSAAAARKLSVMNIGEATWSDPTDATYRQVILPHEQQFVTRIKLQQAP